jgi:two-component system sensor histidine kinase/response regulator
VSREILGSGLVTGSSFGEAGIGSFFGIYRSTLAGELLSANAEMARIYGFGCVDSLLAASSDFDFSFYAHARRRAEFLQQLDEEGCVRDFESTVRRHDGLLAWIGENASPSRGPDGEIVFIEGTIQDITPRKQREMQRHDSEEKLQTLIGSVEDSLWSVDAGYRLITFNAPFIRMFVELTGYVLKAGDRLTDLIPEDWREEEIIFYQRALRGERFVVEQRYMSFTGERFYELSFNPIYGAEGVSGVAVISKDSTERHRTQIELKMAKSAAESANRLKSEFLANMSHEIRTPMNGIIGITDLLMRTPLAPDQREFIQTVRTSGESLLTVINDILDFSKIEAGKLQFENIDFDLHEVVEGTLDLFAAPALAKKIEVGAVVRADVPSSLRGDPSRLRQVINNLLSNAIKFTERGEIVLTVSKLREDAGRIVLDFQVRDTGIGIESSAQGRLFEAFSQADGSTTRKYGGTGLGLVISKRLAALMNGDIRVESTLGEGSVFFFTAEFEKPAELKIAPTVEGLRVLVVSSNATTTSVLKEYLPGWKAEAHFTDHLESAFTLIEESRARQTEFQAVIVDLDLNGGEPTDLARSIGALGAGMERGLMVLTSIGQQFPGLDQVPNATALAKPIKQTRLLAVLSGGATKPAEGQRLEDNSICDGSQSAATALRILLAEDNSINQKVACGLLRNLGHRATVAVNGEQVLAALAAESYDLVFMDCQMPVMDGFEATRRIRELKIRQPVIVAMTANALPGDRERCLAAGMDDYITKPIRSELLQEKIASFFSAS